MEAESNTWSIYFPQLIYVRGVKEMCQFSGKKYVNYFAKKKTNKSFPEIKLNQSNFRIGSWHDEKQSNHRIGSWQNEKRADAHYQEHRRHNP